MGPRVHQADKGLSEPIRQRQPHTQPWSSRADAAPSRAVGAGWARQLSGLSGRGVSGLQSGQCAQSTLMLGLGGAAFPGSGLPVRPSAPSAGAAVLAPLLLGRLPLASLSAGGVSVASVTRPEGTHICVEMIAS